MSTAPLPPVGGRDPATLPDGVPVVLGGRPGRYAAAAAGRPAPRSLRIAESLAGLLTAGVAVVGVVLLAAQLIAPRTSGSGLEASTGPGWDRVVATLAVAAVGETLRAVRRRLPGAARAAGAVAMIAGVLVVLWFTWWR